MKSTDSVGRSRKPVSATEALEVRSLPRTHVPLSISRSCAREPASHTRERDLAHHIASSPSLTHSFKQAQSLAALLQRRAHELELREADLQARAQALQQREKKFSRRNPLRDMTVSDVILTERLGRGAGGTIVSACLVKGWFGWL